MKKNILLLASLLLVIGVSAQKDDDYPSGVSYTHLNKNVPNRGPNKLRDDLIAGDFDSAMVHYFGTGEYDGKLPDIICFINKNNDIVKIGIAHKKDGWNKKQILWGKPEFGC